MDFTNKAAVARLVADCINGDKKSQQFLYSNFYSKMLGVCNRYAKNFDEAKDILHDGYLKVFDKLGSFSNKGSLEGWIRRIMVNNAIDHVRKKKEIFYSLNDNTKFEINDTEESDQDLFIQEKAEVILNLIQKLSPGYRTVFNLYIIDNYTHKEIAEALGINIGTSKSNYAKAKIKIKEYYKTYLDDRGQRK